MDTTIENMINSIDLSAPVPEYEPMRQYYYLKACRKIVKEKSEALNRPLTAVVSTFGCQMNARDSEKLLGILKDIGYQESDDEENADFVIYNTCSSPVKHIYISSASLKILNVPNTISTNL